MTSRTRGDLCPGVLRPWPAEDGALVRLRLVGGAISPQALRGLLAVAEQYGDGTVHLTRRANLQLRALPARDVCLDAAVVAAIETTGLLPSSTHELVRNIMVSPLTGLVADRAGGRPESLVDLRPVAAALDAGLCADPTCAGLSARFLFVLDDGRGDVVDRSCDLGLMAVDESRVQLRVGDDWGPVVPVAAAVPELLDLARAFVGGRGTGPSAPWHVRELAVPLGEPEPQHRRTLVRSGPPRYGPLGSRLEHVAVPKGLVDRALLDRLLAPGPAHLVVTPWRSIITAGSRADEDTGTATA